MGKSMSKTSSNILTRRERWWDVLKETHSVTSLAPIGPDKPLSSPGHHNWGIKHSQSHQAGDASARLLVFPSWIHAYQVVRLCFELKQKIRQSPPQEEAREGIGKTYTKLIQASDNLRGGGGKRGRKGREEGFIHFHDNSHREKKCSPASPWGLELNSQGCQSDQKFNSVYSVGRLSGASASASGWCPEPAQAEQPESWICLACHAMRDSGHMHREAVSLSLTAMQS